MFKHRHFKTFTSAPVLVQAELYPESKYMKDRVQAVWMFDQIHFDLSYVDDVLDI